MRCFEVWINDKRVGLVGHAEAETVSATLEATTGIDVVILELIAELSSRDEKMAYATWGTHSASVSDELRIRIVESPSADPGAVVVQGIGEVASTTVWPLCSFCGRSYHDANHMVRPVVAIYAMPYRRGR